VTCVDTHTHLCDSSFDADRDEVLARARRAGVRAIVVVGESLADAERNLELADLYPDLLRPAAGLFPTRLDRREGERIEELLRSEANRWIAVGEVGLDYWKVQEEEERELQRELFSRFITLSLELDLPLNVHSRSAGRQTIELLLAEGARRVQMHAFDGRAAKALPAVEAGYFFSVPPSIERSAQKQKLVKRLPLSCLLLETDSPVLGPSPRERNEPANVRHSALAVAELQGISEGEVLEVTTDNAVRLYGERLLGR
jgi:TatD DNase family protein